MISVCPEQISVSFKAPTCVKGALQEQNLGNHMHVVCVQPGGGELLACPRWQWHQHSLKMITGHHTSPSVAKEVSIWSFILIVRFKGREMRVDRSCHGCVSGPENICLEASNSQRFDLDLWPGRYLDLFLLRQDVFIATFDIVVSHHTFVLAVCGC